MAHGGLPTTGNGGHHPPHVSTQALASSLAMTVPLSHPTAVPPTVSNEQTQLQQRAAAAAQIFKTKERKVSSREVQLMLEKNDAALRAWSMLHKQEPSRTQAKEHKEWIKRCLTLRQQIGSRLEVLASLADKQIAQEEPSESIKKGTPSAVASRSAQAVSSQQSAAPAPAPAPTPTNVTPPMQPLQSSASSKPPSTGQVPTQPRVQQVPQQPSPVAPKPRSSSPHISASQPMNGSAAHSGNGIGKNGSQASQKPMTAVTTENVTSFPEPPMPSMNAYPPTSYGNAAGFGPSPVAASTSTAMFFPSQSSTGMAVSTGFATMPATSMAMAHNQNFMNAAAFMSAPMGMMQNVATSAAMMNAQGYMNGTPFYPNQFGMNMPGTSANNMYSYGVNNQLPMDPFNAASQTYGQQIFPQAAFNPSSTMNAFGTVQPSQQMMANTFGYPGVNPTSIQQQQTPSPNQGASSGFFPTNPMQFNTMASQQVPNNDVASNMMAPNNLDSGDLFDGLSEEAFLQLQ